jgi:hypothetical protein
VAVGVGPIPVPERLKVVKMALKESGIVSEPDAAPFVVGVKVTPIVHVPPAASGEEVQSFV